MNKPTIPNEVADVIEGLRNESAYQNVGIIDIAMRTGGGLHRDTVTLQTIPFDILMAALVNGYDREMTEEERIHREIRVKYVEKRSSARLMGHAWHSRETSAYADGIRFALDTLGIQIEGVNA